MTAAGRSEASEVHALEKDACWTVGSIGYLVSTAWWSAWLQYSSYAGPGAAPAPSLLQLPGGSGPRPGPISNSDLLPLGHSTAKSQLPGVAAPQTIPQSASDPDQGVPLRLGLIEQRDFVVVSAATWKRLQSWYGGGPEIARRVVAEAAPAPTGSSTATTQRGRLAVYPILLEACYVAKDGKERSVVLAMDQEASLATLKARACAALGVAESEVVLWDCTGGRPVKSLEAALGGEEAAAAKATSSAPTNVEADRALPAASTRTDGGNMDVDATAPVRGAGTDKSGIQGDVMRRAIRELPLLDGHLLELRRTDVIQASSDADDEDACGSDNEKDTGLSNGKKKTGRKAGTEAEVTPAAVAMRRASAAGSSRSDGGLGIGLPAPPAPPVTGRSSGGLFANNRLGSQRSLWGSFEDNVIPREGQPPGLTGLSNLGNTCFMNSSLQCLAHAVPLMEAFLGGAYLQDLNHSNPLGMKGELAEAFGALLEQLWRGGLSAVTPRSFKAKIGRFAPQFSGYAQHDSQEFLAFLLDGLHEDTNRIQKKPYIEERDDSGQPDEVLATEAWAKYRARNDSLVVDHFQGLFKSTVDCPQCGFNSVKFDPFMYLSLPLPESRRRVVEVVLVRTDGSELPCRMALELLSGATLLDLLQATASAGGLPADAVSLPESHLLAARPLRGSSSNNNELVLLTDGRMRLADALDAGVHGGSSYTLRSASQNADSTLVVYYYPDPTRGPRADGMAPVIVHFKRPDRRAASWSRGVWCGAPLVLFMPEGHPPYDPRQVEKVPLTSGPSSRSEWEISGDCPLTEALRMAMRPIQRGPLLEQPTVADTARVAQEGQQAASPTAGELPTVVVEGSSLRAKEVIPHAAQRPAGTPSSVESAPMEEDGRSVVIPESTAVVMAEGGSDKSTGAVDDALCPGTPISHGNRVKAAGSSGGGEVLRTCRSSGNDKPPVTGAVGEGAVFVGGDVMEGLETLEASGVHALSAAPVGGLAGSISSMPGTPQGTWALMEEDPVTARTTLPEVILAGPPEGMDAGTPGLGPCPVEPFDMWAAQNSRAGGESGLGDGWAAPSQSPVNAAVHGSTGSCTGRAFSIKLCTNNGDSALWGGIYEKDINPEHHRNFLLLFSEACATGGAAGGCASSTAPYAAELLDSPVEHPSLRKHRQLAAAGPQPVTLDACMNTFLQPERLAESDAWYCPHCKAHVCADKKLDLWSLPEVLVVHLKRFNYTRYSRNKLDTRVDFPLHGLDLVPYVMRPQGVPPVYDLFAVSNHYGSMGGGHYTAYAKLPSPTPQHIAAADRGGVAATPALAASPSERWYCFDDSYVSEVNPEAVRSPAAYVLFYRRRSESAADPPDVGQLLKRLRQQRVDQQQLLQPADIPSARGTDRVDPGGRERHLDNDQDQDQHQDQDQGGRSGAAYGGERRGCVGPLGAAGEVSIATAAAAAQAARSGGSGGDNDEELEVEGRSMAAFCLGCSDPTVAVVVASVGYDNQPTNGRGAVDAGSSESYGDADGAIAVGSPSLMPMSVGNTHGGAGGGEYDPSDYGAFAMDDVEGGTGGCGVGGGLGGEGDGALLQLPGSPADVDEHLNSEAPLDMNNAVISGLYGEVDAMDVAGERHSGSDMVSADGNDLDADVDDNDDASNKNG